MLRVFADNFVSTEVIFSCYWEFFELVLGVVYVLHNVKGGRAINLLLCILKLFLEQILLQEIGEGRGEVVKMATLALQDM